MPYVSKITVGPDEIDLTNDGTNEQNVLKGVRGHDSSGRPFVGELELTGGGGYNVTSTDNGDGTQTIYVTVENDNVIDKSLYAIIAQRACNISAADYGIYTQADKALLRDVYSNVPLEIYDVQTGGSDRFNISCPSYLGNVVRVRIALYTNNGDGTYSRNGEPTAGWKPISTYGGFDFVMGTNEYIAVNIMIVNPETETSITITESIASWLHDNFVIERG